MGWTPNHNNHTSSLDKSHNKYICQAIIMSKLKSISRRAIIASLALFGLFAIFGTDDTNVPMRNLEEKKNLVVCHGWCLPHPDPFDMKCTFKNCVCCSKCFELEEEKKKKEDEDEENQVSAKYCDGWCLPHSDPWDMKCTFKRCNGCGQCLEQEDGKPLEKEQEQNQEVNLSSQEEQQQEDNEQSPRPHGECQSWCLPHPDPWDMKCTFKHCDGCDKCLEEKPDELSDADQNRFVGWGTELERYLMTHL